MRTLLTIALAALGVSSYATAQPTSSGGAAASAAVPAPTTAADFVRMAGASDLYEIQSSQAVLQTAKNSEVRNFAQMMIDHHTKTTQQVTAAAKAAGLTPPPPQLDARKAQMLQQLQQAEGAARERLYITQQIMAHKEALALHTGYANKGDSAPLRAAASQAAPIVQQHLTQIQRIQSAMAG